MRSVDTKKALIAALCAHFDSDVAEAITNDAEDMLDAVVARISELATTPDDVVKLVVAIADKTSDRTLDWLADRAESPAGWLYSQL
jgi:hypothetical protein